jgi:ATP adenylyltransferase
MNSTLPDPACRFCQLASEVPGECPIYIIDDGYPVTKGHKLLIPRRHAADPFSLEEEEASAMLWMLRETRAKLLIEDPSIDGFNVGFNAGESAGQTIMHAHVHLIPRRAGDTPQPRGGVRGVIPGRMSY